MSHAAAPAATRPRWRFTFRLSTLFVVITIAAIACAGPRFYRQWQVWEIKRYINQDLRSLPASEQLALQERMRRIWPELQILLGGTLVNCYLWQITSDRGVRLVLFQEEEFLGDVGAQLTLFDNAGNCIRRIQIAAVDRTRFLDASISTTRLPSEAIVALKTLNLHAGYQVQYYAFINDHSVLIHAENPDGTIHHWPWTYIWDDPDKKVPAESWSRQLSDSREVKLLQAMHWIRRDTPKSNVSIEVRERLTELSRHGHPWVAEAAAATLKKLPMAEGE